MSPLASAAYGRSFTKGTPPTRAELHMPEEAEAEELEGRWAGAAHEIRK